MPRYILNEVDLLELSPKASRRSKPETPSCSRSSRTGEIKIRRKELTRERPLLPMLKSTTKSTQLPKLISLMQRERPRLLETSLSSQKLS